ncbi:MAG: hypothetical protein ABEJ64_01035 [Candidatus Nanohaloarchaea archaeon]
MDMELRLSQQRLMDVSKPLFYGLTFMAGISLAVSPAFSGTLLGQAVLASIAFVAAGLGEELDDDWARFLDLISVTSLLMVVLFAAYTAARLSML